jgi:hypothetical protein
MVTTIHSFIWCIMHCILILYWFFDLVYSDSTLILWSCEFSVETDMKIFWYWRSYSSAVSSRIFCGGLTLGPDQPRVSRTLLGQTCLPLNEWQTNELLSGAWVNRIYLSLETRSVRWLLVIKIWSGSEFNLVENASIDRKNRKSVDNLRFEIKLVTGF